MKILSVVTLISKLGEYGGPVRVALNQAAALQDRGHDVVVAAATQGFEDVPAELSGVPLALFSARQVLPRSGFAGMAAPGMLPWITRHAPSTDVVHVHAARDLVTLPAALLVKRAGTPYVLQTHGMIDPSSHPLAAPVDALLTRPVLKGASRVFHLTELERNQLREVAGRPLPFAPLPNGVPFADPSPADGQEGPEVLFLARLASRKRPLAMVALATALHTTHPRARFTLVGPDEGEGQKVARAIDDARAAGVPITWEGPLAPEDTLARINEAAVYVLPSVDEPYPMSVLEAMSVAKPVVVTDTCGLAPVVAAQDCGAVVDDSLDHFVTAVDGLLSDPRAAAAKGERGRAHVREQLSMAAIATELERHYLAVIGGQR